MNLCCCNRFLAKDITARDGDVPFQFWELRNADEPPPQYLNRNICISLAVYTYLAISVDRSSSNVDAEFFVSSLVGFAAKMWASIETVAEGTIEVGTRHIVVDRHGNVSGFSECLSQPSVHLAIQELFKRDWQVQCNAGVLVSPLGRDTQNLADILNFVLMFARRRRAAGKTVSGPCSRQFEVNLRSVRGNLR